MEKYEEITWENLGVNGDNIKTDLKKDVRVNWSSVLDVPSTALQPANWSSVQGVPSTACELE
jgi:hypothetical protein